MLFTPIHKRKNADPGVKFKGFTLVELCLGIALTALVLGALASFLLAMSRAWQSTENTNASILAATQISKRVERELSSAKYIGAVSNGSGGGNASVFYWADDNFGGVSDGAVQFGEMRMIEFDTAGRSILLRRAKPIGSMTPEQLAEASRVISALETDDPAVAAFFKTRSFVDSPLPLGGRGTSFTTAGTQGLEIDRVLFSRERNRDENAQNVRFVLGVKNRAAQAVQSATVALRAPTTRPAEFSTVLGVPEVGNAIVGVSSVNVVGTGSLATATGR
jgi:type II secretory pathway pseudopilin PulG